MCQRQKRVTRNKISEGYYLTLVMECMHSQAASETLMTKQKTTTKTKNKKQNKTKQNAASRC